jgi:hypothetical protein
VCGISYPEVPLERGGLIYMYMYMIYIYNIYIYIYNIHIYNTPMPNRTAVAAGQNQRFCSGVGIFFSRSQRIPPSRSPSLN